MDEKDIEHLINTLSAADAVVCYASSFAVDAAYFDVPIITIGFETRKNILYAKRATLHYRFEHYRKILNLNATSHVHTPSELASELRAALSERGAKKTERKALAKDQLHFLDGTSGKRIAERVLGVLRAGS
ncbi:MAG: hypothetical protein Q7R74_00365 [bacterium]|nr:hypothetical protein [bacterium]